MTAARGHGRSARTGRGAARRAGKRAAREPSARKPAPPPLRSGRIAALLAVLAFLLFNVNGREAYPTGDSRPTGLLPFSILYEHDLDLNEYHPPGATVAGPIRSENGRIVSNYSPLPAFLSLPIYVPAWPHRAEIDGDMFRWEPFFSKLAGSIWASLAVAVFFLAACEMASQRAAVLTTLVLAFASPFWVSASQTLGQHALTVLFGSLMLLGLARLERGGGRRWAIVVGLACALAVGVRLTNAVLFVAALVYVAVHHRRQVLAFAAPALLGAVPLVLYLVTVLGGAWGGLRGFGFATGVLAQFRGSAGRGLPGLLISPGEGLFVWAPVLVLLLLPLGSVLARPPSDLAQRRLVRLSLVTGLALLLVYSRYVAWWGGRTYGPRYATELLPFLLLPVAVGLDRWLERRAFWIAFVALFVWSSYVQVLGAFRYPCPGDDPGRLRLDEYRIWDWADTDIGLCAHSLRRPPSDFESARRLVAMTWRSLVR